MTSVTFGMRLRNRGVKQLDNVNTLLQQFPEITDNESEVELTFDRGYGKMSFIKMVSKMNYKIRTVAASVGSRHPFILNVEIQKR